MLKFSPANAKTELLQDLPQLANGKKWYSVDLLSGWTCPFAKHCKSSVHCRPDGSRYVKDGPHTIYRCFSASQEVLYPPLYNLRRHNTQQFKQCKSSKQVCNLICQSMPQDAGIIRPHVAGDFYNVTYFEGWIKAAENNPDKLFYAYTKNIKAWMQKRYKIPENFILTASTGGKLDHMIKPCGIRSATVVYSESEADKLGLPIDHDDSHAIMPNGDFALLIHGVQPKGSKAGKAVKALRGNGSYKRK